MDAAVAHWVTDTGVWIGILAGLCTLIAFLYGFTRFVARSFRNEVRDVVQEENAPIHQEIATLRGELRNHMTLEDQSAAEVKQWRRNVDRTLWQIQDSLTASTGTDK